MLLECVNLQKCVKQQKKIDFYMLDYDNLVE